MELTLRLSPELEEQLRERAKQRGVSIEQYVGDLLAERFKSEDWWDQAAQMFQAWFNDANAEDETACRAQSVKYECADEDYSRRS